MTSSEGELVFLLSGKGNLPHTTQEEKNLNTLLDLMNCRTETCELYPGFNLTDTRGRMTLISTMSHRAVAEKKICVASTHFIAPPDHTSLKNSSINNIINQSLLGAEQVGGLQTKMALRNWREAVTRLAKAGVPSHIVVFSCSARSTSDESNNLQLDAGGHQIDLRTADQLCKDKYKSHLLILHLSEMSGPLPTHIATTVTTSAPIIVSQQSSGIIGSINIIERDALRTP